MTLRVIEITAPAGYADTLVALAEQYEAVEVFAARSADSGAARCIVHLVCETNRVQEFTDAVQMAIGRGEPWRAVTLAVEGTVPKYEPRKIENRPAFRGGAASREEIQAEVARNAELNSTFLVLTFLSAIAAAVLSLVAGLSSALVGVMVAVALMPPAVAAGIMLGAGNPEGALGAAMLLGVNIVCVNLAAQTVFVAKGIRPRTWWEQKASATSLRINFAMWLALLMALVAAIYWLKLPVLPPQFAGPGAEIAGE